MTRRSSSTATPKQVAQTPIETRSSRRKAKQDAIEESATKKAKNTEVPVKSSKKDPPTPKVVDKWSAIENGEAKSAADVHYKPPNKENEPKKVYPKKHIRLSVGLDTQERLPSHQPLNQNGAVKRSATEEATPKTAKKSKTDKVNKTIVLSDSPVRKSLAKVKNVTTRKNKDDTMQIFQTRSSVGANGNSSSNNKKKASETVIIPDSESDEDEDETFVVDEEDMAGLESDENDNASDILMERMLNSYVNGEGVPYPPDLGEDYEDEEVEDEESVGDEEFDDEEDEVEEDVMRWDPRDAHRIVDDGEDMEIDEEDGDDEQEDEELDEEISDEESVVSEQDAESDNEGFISGEDREATIIQAPEEKRKSSKKERHSLLAVNNKAPVDFDKFPFHNEDSVVSATKAFSYLISACDVQTFFDKFYQSNVLVVHRKQPNYYGNLFSTARLSELLEKNHLEYGVNINIAEYKNGERLTMNGKGRVYPQIVKQHLSSLRSVQLVNPQTFDDRIWYICEVLQELFGCFVGANTYLTPAGSSGFAPHWDEIDAFLLQVEGRKYWRVWAPEVEEDELPLESSGNFTEKDMEGRKPTFEGWIESGDVLYIPRGFIHQARTDENVHSLHVTISTGRRWSFADLMEKLIPQAVSSFTEQRAKLRRGLPIGLFDMSGNVELEYPQAEHFADKFQTVLDRHMSMLRNFVADVAMDSSVDLMAREFMKQALPPMLTEEEKKLSVVGQSVELLDDELVEFNAKTKIRLVRKHTQRLILEDDTTCFIAHRMANSRLFEGRPEQIEDFPIESVDVFAFVSDSYPEWRTLEEVFSAPVTSDLPRKVQLAAIQRLFEIGVLLVKN